MGRLPTPHTQLHVYPCLCFAVSSVRNASALKFFSPPMGFPTSSCLHAQTWSAALFSLMSGHNFCSQEPPECQPQGKSLCTHYHVELSIKPISAQDFTPFTGEKTDTEVTGWPQVTWLVSCQTNIKPASSDPKAHGHDLAQDLAWPQKTGLMESWFIWAWGLRFISNFLGYMLWANEPIQQMWVRSLCWEDPLEEEITTHSSIFAWKIPWTVVTGRPQSMGLQRVGHDWAHTQTQCA